MPSAADALEDQLGEQTGGFNAVTDIAGSGGVGDYVWRPLVFGRRGVLRIYSI